VRQFPFSAGGVFRVVSINSVIRAVLNRFETRRVAEEHPGGELTQDGRLTETAGVKAERDHPESGLINSGDTRRH